MGKTKELYLEIQQKKSQCKLILWELLDTYNVDKVLKEMENLRDKLLKE